jgi:predicted SnoaL-like aldol condensation-catalyzing enzyme
MAVIRAAAKKRSFRFEDDRVVEHWAVLLQEKVPAEQTVAGNAMFKAL